MVFGTGIPLFYLLGAISFASMYFSSQFIFYYWSQKPQTFDHSINSFIGKVLLIGLAFHQLMAVVFLYVHDVFPQLENSQSDKKVLSNT